jgi:hypothetical protein
VLKAAGVKSAYVHGAAYAGADGKKIPANTRVMMVEHDKNVQLVNAPVDRTKPVTRMTTGQANKMGLYTQSQAKALATKNGGKLGSARTVQVANAGIGARGNSYRFDQTKPDTKVVKEWGGVYREGKISRTVTVTGSGESATSGSSKLLRKIDPTPAPAATPAAK